MFFKCFSCSFIQSKKRLFSITEISVQSVFPVSVVLYASIKSPLSSSIKKAAITSSICFNSRLSQSRMQRFESSEYICENQTTQWLYLLSGLPSEQRLKVKYSGSVINSVFSRFFRFGKRQGSVIFKTPFSSLMSMP